MGKTKFTDELKNIMFTRETIGNPKKELSHRVLWALPIYFNDSVPPKDRKLEHLQEN